MCVCVCVCVELLVVSRLAAAAASGGGDDDASAPPFSPRATLVHALAALGGADDGGGGGGVVGVLYPRFARGDLHALNARRWARVTEAGAASLRVKSGRLLVAAHHLVGAAGRASLPRSGFRPLAAESGA